MWMEAVGPYKEVRFRRCAMRRQMFEIPDPLTWPYEFAMSQVSERAGA